MVEEDLSVYRSVSISAAFSINDVYFAVSRLIVERKMYLTVSRRYYKANATGKNCTTA